MSTIAVLGSANLDLVVRQPHRAAPGETIFGTGFTTGAGGKGLNQAVAAARAGAHVRFIGAIGADDFGLRLRTTLKREGIDTGRLRTVAHDTGIAQITVTDDGENSIVVVPGANADEAFDELDRQAVASASHLVVQLERPRPLVERALRFARSQGVVTVLTPAPADRDAGDLVDLADVLVPNEGEARILSGEPDSEAAARALSLRAGTVVLTRGAQGALVARGGQIVRAVAARSVVAVDTTGAGDTFTGVLVAWLAAGRDLDGSLEAASAAAAVAVGRHGAADSIPSLDEISSALDAD